MGLGFRVDRHRSRTLRRTGRGARAGTAGTHGGLDSSRGFDRVFVLPHADDGPAGLTECDVVGAIALHVAVELRLPVVGVGDRMRCVNRTPMPEAAVDEDGYSRRTEHEVGTDAAITRVDP